MDWLAKGTRVLVAARAFTAYGEQRDYKIRLLHKDRDPDWIRSYAGDNIELVHCPPGGELNLVLSFDRPSTGTANALWREPFGELQRVIVIGWTQRATGVYHKGRNVGLDHEPPALIEDKRHSVYVVVDTTDDRYSEPFLCLPEDVIVTKEA